MPYTSTAKKRTPRRALKFELHRRGLKVNDMAAALGVSPTTVSRWCRGHTTPPDALKRRADVWLRRCGIDPEAAWVDVAPVGTVNSPPPAPPPPPPHPARPPLRLVDGDDVDDDGGDGPPPSPPDEEFPVNVFREYLTLDELDFFGLESDPFDEPDDPSECWLPPHLQQIERQMHRSIRQRRIFALVGDPGAGKSTLLRRLRVQALQSRRIRLIEPAALDRRRVTSSSLEVAILRDLTGEDTTGMAAEKRSRLMQEVLADHASQGVYPVVFIDEAHHLTSAALLGVKHLFDSHALFRQISLVLAGQMPLWHRLHHDPAVREVAGRTHIVVLPDLGKTAADYLAWRFARVGADVRHVLTPEAIEALSLRGKGPLWISNLAILAMRQAHEVGDRRVAVEHVGRS